MLLFVGMRHADRQTDRGRPTGWPAVPIKICEVGLEPTRTAVMLIRAKFGQLGPTSIWFRANLCLVGLDEVRADLGQTRAASTKSEPEFATVG